MQVSGGPEPWPRSPYWRPPVQSQFSVWTLGTLDGGLSKGLRVLPAHPSLASFFLPSSIHPCPHSPTLAFCHSFFTPAWDCWGLSPRFTPDSLLCFRSLTCPGVPFLIYKMDLTCRAVVKGSAHGKISKTLTLVGICSLSGPSVLRNSGFPGAYVSPGHDMGKTLENTS